MATILDFACAGTFSAGLIITIFNKAISDGARNWAARLAWALIGTAFGIYVFGCIRGMLYSLDAGVVVAGSRGGGRATFHRDEHPLLFGITFLGLTCATGAIAFLSIVCLWKAVKKD